MFKTRLLSGIILVAVLILVIGLGGNMLFGFSLLISLIGMYELNKVVKLEKTLPGITSLLCGVLYYIVLYIERKKLMMAIMIGSLIIMMSVYVLSFPKYHANQIITSFFGILYVAVMISYIYQARMLRPGVAGVSLVILIFISAWGNDTCAYCVGMLIGKHKMAPILSPKKSIEGAIGGVVGATLLGAVFAWILNSMGKGSHSVIFYGLICGVGAIISMMGDLAASAIKRNHEIKDYGNLIPGHGGILDRFDSVIFTAPVIYYMAVLLL